MVKITPLNPVSNIILNNTLSCGTPFYLTNCRDNVATSNLKPAIQHQELKEGGKFWEDDLWRSFPFDICHFLLPNYFISVHIKHPTPNRRELKKEKFLVPTPLNIEFSSQIKKKKKTGFNFIQNYAEHLFQFYRTGIKV